MRAAEQKTLEDRKSIDEAPPAPSKKMLIASDSQRQQLPQKKGLQSQVVKKDFCGDILYTTHPGAIYKPYAVSPFGDTVELHDGSMWSICSEDRPYTFNWLTSDDLVIIPNSDWFSLYTYRIVNQQTGASVRANLALGPIYRGIFTYWIVAIDYINGQVCLQDGSIWTMSPIDFNIIKKWMINDTVIIGVNNGAFAAIRPNILINVNMNNYGMGSCLFY
jgi:hypothetical protein